MRYPLGDIFPETIVQVSNKSKTISHVFHHETKGSGERIFLFIAILIFGLGYLAVRLFSLTVLEGSIYRGLSEGNRIREVKITAPRGIIYDRNGTPLVHNIPIFINDKTRETFFTDGENILAKYSRESVDREYIYNELFAHALGYTGEMSEEELKSQNAISSIVEGSEINPSENMNTKSQKAELGDKIGKMGIEKAYDGKLRGQNGKELKEFDARGEMVRTLGRVEPIAGESLNLSLDLDMHKIASDSLKDKKGAIVVTSTKTSEIIALYSSPSFNPNDFVTGNKVEKILEADDKPLFNRAVSGLYPPGSTFKIITATAGLESGAIDKNTKIEDTGVLTVGQYSFGNWYFSQYGKKEGVLDLVNAIRRSNDIFFYKVGEMVGIEKLSVWAKKFGVGQILGLDIPGEEKGIMPDPQWLDKTRRENWYLGNTYHAAIGQGDLLTTPLQVNAWTNVIANGGKLCRPHMAADKSEKRKAKSEECKDLGIKKETIDLIREGMREACSPGGTGWPLFKFKVQSAKFKVDGIDFLETYESTTSGKPIVEIPVACKTGTAEFGDPKGRTHAWITVFAPTVNPQISVTVLVEGGGEGSSVAGPIAKKMLEGWFGKQNI